MDDMIRCNQCRQPIAPRSIRPGAVLCPRCRHSTFTVTIHRGDATPTTPEERAQLQAQADAARAAALAAPAPRERTPEHNIEEAWKNGSLQITAYREQYASERAGRPITDDEALDHAKEVIVTYGATQGRSRGAANLPHVYYASGPAGAHERLGMGTHPGGRQGRAIGAGGPSAFRSKSELKRDRADAIDTAKRVAAQKARREMEAGAKGTDRQREAYRLVRIERLSKAEAGRRMGIAPNNVIKLLAKYDKSTKTAK